MDFVIGTANVDWMNRYHVRYGSTFQLDSLFGKTRVMTIAPENLQAVYANGKNFGIQPHRLHAMEYFCGQGFLTTDGHTWQNSRRMLKPSFAKGNISDFTFLSREVESLMNKIPRDGSTVDLQPLLFLMAVAYRRQFLNTSLHFLLGVDRSPESESAPCTAESFVGAFHEAIKGTGIRIMLGRFKGLAPKKQYYTACHLAHEYLDYYVQQAFEHKSYSYASPSSTGALKTRNMIQGLASQTDDVKYIRSQILQGMIASEETTAVLISNTIFLLSRHPQYWQQLRDQVREQGEELFNFEQLSKFVLLQNILSESLRLYPVFSHMSRTCLNDTTLPIGGGADQKQPILITQGANVFTSFYTLHRDKSVFGPDAESFAPERWERIHPAQWEYLPFGGGQRACLGKEKVLAEAAFVVARLAQRFEKLESEDARPWKGKMRLSAKNLNGCKVCLL
ncbi:cytochrome P450 [Lentithecium fluviatile CBS 122367]|uniref:Cytochrome P450 n=1 Tax=Lentithecium fluviatile CBS 122367 TaxID=1168545 RepID=A0A6G1ICL8_9PLEO|nr:cytochrome P450 [Lentithecium fluviatile CBS 122367]